MPLYRVEEGQGLADTLAAIQWQSVLRFASSTDRAGRLLTPRLGLLTFLDDVLRFEWWNGSGWTVLGQDATLAARVTALEGRMAAVEAKNTTQDSRLTALEAKAPMVWNGGATTVSTDGIAMATIAHGLGTAPRLVLATMANQTSPNGASAVNDWALVQAITASTFTVRLGDSHGDQYVNRPNITLYWMAVV
jgi:hypothetical protein